MKRTAVFAGTFDPVTKGHEEIIKKALLIFDSVHVLLAVNPGKKCFFDEEKRLGMLMAATDALGEGERLTVCAWHGYLYEYCLKVGAHFIVKGARGKEDFEYEKALALGTKELCPEIETLIMIPDKEYGDISSTKIRKLIEDGEDVSEYLPKAALDALGKYL